MKKSNPDNVKHSGWYYGYQFLERISDIVILIVLLMGIYLAYDTLYVYYHAKTGNVYYTKPDTVETLQKEVSDEAIAWITLDDTSIDYPIMQCDNNIKYLNTDAYGEYSLAGAIFMDFRCSSDFTDDYNLIYGHHMGSEMMFSALDEFSKKEYFDSHKTGSLMTKDREIPLDIVAFLPIDASNEEIFDPELREADVYAYCENHAKFKRTIDRSRHLLALSTCKEPISTERTVLICQYDLNL